MVGMIGLACYTSTLEPKNIKEVIIDDYWIEAMQKELHQFKKNAVWDLVPRPKGVNVIGMKWVYRNMTGENGNITRQHQTSSTRVYSSGRH